MGHAPSRVGHGPFASRLGFSWPLQPMKMLFYDTRPDLIKHKTGDHEWLMLSSQWRYMQAVFCYVGPPSHILHNIAFPYSFILVVSAGAVIWQSIAVTSGLPHIDPEAKFREGFRLTSFIMSLLLTFRLNRSYDRWYTARISVTSLGQTVATFFGQAAVWVQDETVVSDMRRFSIVWMYSVKKVLECGGRLDPAAENELFPDELKVMDDAEKKRQVACTKLRMLVYKVSAALATVQFSALENSLVVASRAASDAIRIKHQAMPNAVNLTCTGFVMIWCCLLPFGLTSDRLSVDWPAFTSMMIIALLLLAVDEVATQLDDPFRLMPLDEIFHTYKSDINRMLGEMAAIDAATESGRKRAEDQVSASRKLSGVNGAQHSNADLNLNSSADRVGSHERGGHSRGGSGHVTILTAGVDHAAATGDSKSSLNSNPNAVRGAADRLDTQGSAGSRGSGHVTIVAAGEAGVSSAAARRRHVAEHDSLAGAGDAGDAGGDA